MLQRLIISALAMAATLASAQSFEPSLFLWHLDFHNGSLKILQPNGEWVTPVLLGIIDDQASLSIRNTVWGESPHLAATRRTGASSQSRAILSRKRSV